MQGSVDIATCAPDSHERDCPHVSGDHRAYLFYINDVDVSVDGEGHITNIAGPGTGPAVTLVDGVASKAFVTFDADNVPYRTLDRTIDLTLGAKQISLRLDSDQSPWEVQGEITVVDGSYKRNFELTDQITQLGVSTPPVKPFWEEYPTIGGARPREHSRQRQPLQHRQQHRSDRVRRRPRDHRHAPRSASARSDHRRSRQLPHPRHPRRLHAHDRLGRLHRERPGGEPGAQDPRATPSYRDLQGQDHEITLKITNHLDQPRVGPDDLDRLQQVADARAAGARSQPRTASPLARRPGARGRSDPIRPIDKSEPGLRRSDRQGSRRRLGQSTSSARR